MAYGREPWHEQWDTEADWRLQCGPFSAASTVSRTLLHDHHKLWMGTETPDYGTSSKKTYTIMKRTGKQGPLKCAAATSLLHERVVCFYVPNRERHVEIDTLHIAHLQLTNKCNVIVSECHNCLFFCFFILCQYENVLSLNKKGQLVLLPLDYNWQMFN